MPTCPAPYWLDRLLAEELTPLERAGIEAHIEQCVACQSQLERLTASARWQIEPPARAAGPPLPVDLLARLMNDRHRQAALARSGASAAGHSDGGRTGRGGRRAPDWPNIPGYEILQELGRGATGVVFQVRQLRLGRLAALKILHPRHGKSASIRFRREVEAMAWLRHPNLVRIYEVGEHQGRPFFVMEFVSGGGLHRYLKGKPLPDCEAAQLIESLARGVQAAHDQGIVHRDLKPANILLDGQAQQSLGLANPKIADFGLAKHLHRDLCQTDSGAILGTPRYMAPEQACRDYGKVGPLADVYSLGAILYECLTGRPPFQGPTIGTILEQVGSQQPVAPRQWQPNLSPQLEAICLKCLAKEPPRRYASAAALADDLLRFRKANAPAERRTSIPDLPPLVDRQPLTMWRDPEQQADSRRRSVPILVAILFPLGALIATLILLALVLHIGLGRN